MVDIENAQSGKSLATCLNVLLPSQPAMMIADKTLGNRQRI